jgi:hypothetical protein
MVLYGIGLTGRISKKLLPSKICLFSTEAILIAAKVLLEIPKMDLIFNSKLLLLDWNS